MENTKAFHEIGGGSIRVWIDSNGVICLKNCEPHGDPVELAEHEALALANILTKMVNELRG